MKHLITNLSSVPARTLHAGIAERLERFAPGADRAAHFGSVMGEAASALHLRAVVEFGPDRVWATFLDEVDAPPVAFHLTEGARL